MDKLLISKLEDSIKKTDFNLYQEYLKVFNLYNFLIRDTFELISNDKLEILLFFHERFSFDQLDIYKEFTPLESNIFLPNKTKNELFNMAFEYFKNLNYGHSHNESIKLIIKNNPHYSLRSTTFLYENSFMISNLFGLSKELLINKLETNSTKKEFYLIQENEDYQFALIKNVFFKDYSPTFFSKDGITFRFCKKGEIAFDQSKITLYENELLFNKGIYLGDHKVLTNEIEYLIVHIPEKFLESLDLKFEQSFIKKLPYSISSKSLELFSQLESFKNKEVIIYDFLIKLLKDILNVNKVIDFTFLSDLPIEKVSQYIEENLETCESIPELQKLFGYNKNSFIELFKNTYGVSPLKYILNKKLERSCHYLIETNLSVTEICSKLNFSDTSKFSQIFKEKYALTPLQFRKKSQPLKKSENNLD